jgi:hypothetical protein
MTPAIDVASYQRGHLNHLGAPLKVDGDCGPQTRWAMALDSLIAARRAMIREAQCWLGLTEIPPGSNDDPGKIIRSWLMLCRAQPGEPWCASFLSHCIGTVRIAGALNLGRHFPETLMPIAGDMFSFATSGGHGHCGLIGGVSSSELMTYEGNCANSVRCVIRPRSPLLRYSRIVLDTTGTSPGIIGTVPLAPGSTR